MRKMGLASILIFLLISCGQAGRLYLPKPSVHPTIQPGTYDKTTH